jgi:hypothetical protein
MDRPIRSQEAPEHAVRIEHNEELAPCSITLRRVTPIGCAVARWSPSSSLRATRVGIGRFLETFVPDGGRALNEVVVVDGVRTTPPT